MRQRFVNSILFLFAVAGCSGTEAPLAQAPSLAPPSEPAFLPVDDSEQGANPCADDLDCAAGQICSAGIRPKRGNLTKRTPRTGSTLIGTLEIWSRKRSPPKCPTPVPAKSKPQLGTRAVPAVILTPTPNRTMQDRRMMRKTTAERFASPKPALTLGRAIVRPTTFVCLRRTPLLAPVV